MLFKEILGQQPAKGFFREVMARARLPHAYLFTGIAGVGKSSLARAFGMALNCRRPAGGDACGACAVCRQMRRGHFPDFLLLEPHGQSIRIEQIRDLQRTLGYAPAQGRYRIALIRQAEQMTPEAANAFLKTLEEPPPANIFILSTTEPRNLPPTVVSRCQRVAFQPLPACMIRDALLQREDIDPAAAEVLARHAGGSLGKAVELLAKGFLSLRETWIPRFAKLADASPSEALDLAVMVADQGRGSTAGSASEPTIFDLLWIWESWYRDILLVKLGGKEALIINRDFQRQLQKLAVGYNMDYLLKSVRLLDMAEQELQRHRNTLLVLEHTVLNLRRLGGRGMTDTSRREPWLPPERGVGQ